MRSGVMIIFCILLISLGSSSVLALSIDRAFLNATTPINYTTDDLYAYVNGSGSSGQINFTGSWYKNNTRYLPIINYQSYNDEGRDSAFDLKRDNQGNLIATSHSNNAKLRKFNSSGSLLWNSSFECDYNSIPITVDSENNIYVLCQSNDNSQLIIYKLNSSGTNILNVTYPLGDSLYSIHGIELDSSNNTYFSYLNGSYEVIAVKLNSTGSVLWNSSFPGVYEGYDNGDMELDNQSNVIVATRSDSNFSIIKWNSTGSLVWNVTYLANGAGYVRLGALTTDTSRSVIFSSSNTSGSALIVKYNSTGSHMWNLTYKRIAHRSDSIYSSTLVNDTLYVTGRASYRPYVGVIGLDKINATAGTLIWNSTVVLGPVTVSAEGRGVQVADNKVYIWSYVPGTYYGFEIENVSLITLEENFLFNSTSGPLRLASTINNSETTSNENWQFCAYAQNQTAQSTEACSNTLTIFYPYQNLSSCQNLTIHDVVYTLNQSVNSSGTCFTVMADNVTINGAGFIINFSQSGGDGIAINNSNGYDNLSVRNTQIYYGGSSTSSDTHGIVLFNGADNSIIENNTIFTRSNSGFSIYMDGSSYATIGNNSLPARGYSIRMVSSNYTNITYNILSSIIASIYMSGTGSGYNNLLYNNISGASGIYATDYNNISYNNITGSGRGIYFTSGDSNLVFYNSVYSTSSANAALDLNLAHNNSFYYNNFTSTGRYGIEIAGSNNLTLSYNNIIGDENGIFMYGASTENNFDSNNVNARVIAINDESGTSYENFFVYNNSFGQIVWTSDNFKKNLTTVQNITFPGSITISNNSVFVNSTYFVNSSQINSSANVTFYGIGDRGFINPVILKNGVACEDCYNFTPLYSDNVVFNVSSWSEYSIGEASSETTGSSGSSSSSSSSEGGGSPLFRLSEEELNQGYKNKFYKNWRVSFNFNRENYILKIKDIFDKEVKLSISPNVEDTFISVGQEIMLDLNNDGGTDIAIKVNSIDSNGRAYGAVIEMSYISAIFGTGSPSEGLQDEVISTENSSTREILIRISAILILVCAVIFVLYNYRNRMKALRGY